jgi:hypothetical protein
MPTLSRDVVGEERVQWSRAQLLVFRFTFAVAVLSVFRLGHFAAIYVPGGGLQVRAALGKLEFWLRLSTLGIVWLASSLAGVVSSTFQEFRNHIYQSNSVFVLADLAGMFVMASLATIIWTFFDRRRTDYLGLHRGMRLYLRYAMGVAMVSYAVVKIIPTQFGFMTPGELLQPYGQLSRFWVLWNFMVTSPEYTMLAGWAELLAAGLLFFRRTTLLGSLLLAGILVNLVGMNIAYQVEAVLIPVTLLMLDLILLAPYLKPLASILLFRGPATLRPEPEPSRPRWYHSALAQGALLCCLVVPHVNRGLAERRAYYGAGRPVWGMFDVVSYARKGEIIAPLASDGTVWKRVAGDGRYDSLRLTVQFANAEVRQFRLTDDLTHRVWKIRERGGADVGSLQYTVQPDGDIVLDGKIGGDPVRMLLHRADMKKLFPLWKE